MESEECLVYVVDDDSLMRSFLIDSLESRGMTVAAFDSAEAFLEGFRTNHSHCLLLDLSMPGMDGLQLQSELNNRGITIPIIFVTGSGDIPSTVKALKAGAFEFLEKPFEQNTLFQRIDEALNKDRSTRLAINRNQSRFARLTERELEVMHLLISGSANLSSKEIARKLNISHRTVDHHRARIMEKTQTKSITELAKLAERADLIHIEAENQH